MEPPNIFLQWKGTDACLDFYCTCGAQGHFDGYFCHRIRCGKCGKVWTLPDLLPLREATVEEENLPVQRVPAGEE